MKKQFAILLFGCTACGTAFGAVFDWWDLLHYRTICQVNDSKCYGGITAGIDSEWDEDGNCRGRKFICAAALEGENSDAVAMKRTDILHNNGINLDFDTDVYVSAENCYGARKTIQNGAKVSVNGEYVPVWCPGVLTETGPEVVTYGEIAVGSGPDCAGLARDNYVNVLNGNCYGKQYDTRKYSIDCENNTPMIIVLNGANYDREGNASLTLAKANTIFRLIQESAATQRAIHFNQD